MQHGYKMAARCQLKGTKFQFLLVVLNILHYGCGLDIGNISCAQNLENLVNSYKISEKEVTVDCPSSCIEKVYCVVRGSGPYLPTSSLCCAAIHYGVLLNSDGGRVLIKISSESVPHFFGLRRNGIKSKDYPASSIKSFTVAEIQQNGNLRSEEIDAITIELPATTPQAVAEATEKHLPSMTTLATTNRIDTSKPLLQESPTTPLPTEQDITTSSTKLKAASTAAMRLSETITQRLHKTSQDTTPDYNTADSGMDLLGPAHLPKVIGVLVCVFVTGIAVGACLLFICRRCKKQTRHQQHSRPGKSKSKNTSRMEDPEICVCYQNLNSSKQGLLTDPETCNRPCPIRQPLSHDRDVMISEPPIYPTPSAACHREALSCSSRPLISLETESRDSDAPYEDCASGCSGRCNPSQFEF